MLLKSCANLRVKLSHFKDMKELHIIGLMSGTSLDGLDIAACTFTFGSRWEFNIKHSKTVGYSKRLKLALQHLDCSSALEYAKTDHELGRFFGTEVNKFVSATNYQADYISSHGHTIFHQPEINFTTQIGHPSAIAALAGLPVIADFRTIDVHLNGQGAPLVPIGDLLLFPEYTYCLNLGGIANISIKNNDGEIHAFDTGIANMALNFVTLKEGKAYDSGGKIAETGSIKKELLEKLNRIEYHQLPSPKSIGKEWFDRKIKPLVEQALKIHSSPDVLATLCEHIAIQVAAQIAGSGKLLVTGGGAKNNYLMQRMKEHCNAEIILPSEALVDYKEALIFAFLGALRVTNQTNILEAVTGSKSNHSGGCIYRPFMGENNS